MAVALWAAPNEPAAWLRCSKIAEAEAAVSVNEKKWLVMHMHVQLQLDELRGPQTLGSLLYEGAWPVVAPLLGWMLHQRSTEIIGAGSCWLFLLLGWAGWAAAVNNTLPAKAQDTYLQNSAAARCQHSKGEGGRPLPQCRLMTPCCWPFSSV
jgi:hypothetical protein